MPWCFPLCRVEVRGGRGARPLAGSDVVEKRKSKFLFFFFGIEWSLEASEFVRAADSVSLSVIQRKEREGDRETYKDRQRITR